MRIGDRVVVVTVGDEWSGRRGVIDSLRPDGYIEVELDGTGWRSAFWPHDLELEEIVDKKEQKKP